jgi:hypothetical protein
MSGTEEKILTLTYLDGSVERISVWDWDDPAEADLNANWLEGWGESDYAVFGLDPEVDDYIAVNLKALRSMSVRGTEPQDAAPVPAPPITAESYELRDFINR